jgi:hypothetical protein
MISESTEDSFYITLSSNASTKQYSQNTPSHFLNILSQRIQFNDPLWKVGLGEIHIPLTCYNVIEGENIVRYEYINQSGVQQIAKHKITPGYYHTVQQLLSEINKITPSIKLKFSNTVRINVDNNIQSLYLSDMLALQLGFEPKINLLKFEHAPKQPYLNIGYPHQVFVYTDIIQSQFVGDTKAPLLRIAAMTNINHGKVQTIAFQNVHYFPLSKLAFDTVEILLKDHTGENLSFASGTLTVTLHFIRSSSS